MNILITFFVTALLFIQNNEIKLEMKINRKVATKFEDLEIKLTLTNSRDSQLLVHKYIDLGYPIGDYAEVYFELEKNVRTKYQIIEGTTAIDPFPRFDSLGNPLDYLLDTIPAYSTLIKNYNLTEIYSGISKGSYRVRSVFRIPFINNLNEYEVKSKWLYFKVNSENIYYKVTSRF